jgi:hypothetical protein
MLAFMRRSTTGASLTGSRYDAVSVHGSSGSAATLLVAVTRQLGRVAVRFGWTTGALVIATFCGLLFGMAASTRG